ncbi:MAG: helix-turn-helix domain-containing protein [Limnothrix sp. RL_2_0]|nr:helix-turn-helix domain-containing protein [Limnothrix sp. RL_2_0]
MSDSLKIEIKESEEILKEKLRQTSHAVQRSKLQILWWLKTGKVRTVKELVAWSGYHRSCVSRWLSRYRREGLEELLRIKSSPGRPSVMPSAVKEKLVQKLSEESGFSSYKEIQQWLATEQELPLDYKTVHKIVRYDLGAKLKRPRPVSSKQSEGAVDTFKKTSPNT